VTRIRKLIADDTASPETVARKLAPDRMKLAHSIAAARSRSAAIGWARLGASCYIG
jgi:hypothetical protein